MQITNISEVKTNLSSLIKWVQKNNKSIIIGESGKPVAILSPYLENITPRKLGGSWENKVKIAQNFDEPCEETTDSFYNFLDKS